MQECRLILPGFREKNRNFISCAIHSFLSIASKLKNKTHTHCKAKKNKICRPHPSAQFTSSISSSQREQPMSPGHVQSEMPSFGLDTECKTCLINLQHRLLCVYHLLIHLITNLLSTYCWVWSCCRHWKFTNAREQKQTNKNPSSGVYILEEGNKQWTQYISYAVCKKVTLSV